MKNIKIDQLSLPSKLRKTLLQRQIAYLFADVKCFLQELFFLLISEKMKIPFFLPFFLLTQASLQNHLNLQ